MASLTGYELDVLRIMLGPGIGDPSPEVLGLSRTFTGSRYFCEFDRPDGWPLSLPATVTEPIIVGRTPEGDQVGFVVFLTGSTVTIECHSWSDARVRLDILRREMSLTVGIEVDEEDRALRN